MTKHFTLPTRDSFMTYDRETLDSAGVFLVGELERLDPTINEPLAAVTWSRDVELREDVSIADEVASFTNSSFAAAGGISPTGKSWVGKTANAIASLALDISKTPYPLNLWAMELGWTIPELISAQRLGRPVDAQKFEGMTLKWQMDADEQVYIGDSVLPSCYGLLNSTAVTAGNVANGASTSPLWANKTPAEILSDVNTLLNAVWASSGYAVVPTKLLLPPVKFGYIVSQVVSSAGNQSILKFLKENSIVNQQFGKELDIQPVKWATGRGSGGTDRMMAYNPERKYVQFPMVPLQKTPLEYRSLYQMTTYFGRLGQVEWRYAETAGYADGI